MKRYLERKDSPPDPYPALIAEAQVRDRARPPTVCGPLIALLIAGSGVFVILRRAVDPTLPPWVMNTASEGIAEFGALLALFEWVLLGVVAVAPIALVATTLERIWIRGLVIGWPASRVHGLSNVVGGVGIMLAVPMWVIVWERVVLPFERTAIAAAVLGIAIWLMAAARISAAVKRVATRARRAPASGLRYRPSRS